MANEAHLNIFRQGAAVWNKWIERAHTIGPDLCEVELEGVNLSGWNLTHTQFDGANLRGSNLSKAYLYGAKLRKADLCHANLCDADLTGADLSEAILKEALLIRAKITADFVGADLSKADLLQADGAANFNGANLFRACLNQANLRMADLRNANLCEANLRRADLSDAQLVKAKLIEAKLGSADLSGANLSYAKLRQAELWDADLFEANLSGADLSGAILQRTRLVQTCLEQADISNCYIYGISAWGLKLESANQTNLIVTPFGEPTITVDNLEVAQFIYLLLNNKRIRDVIDTLTSKVVLILGRFTVERKAVLDAIREALRHRNYLPVLFDCDETASQSTVESILWLAKMARFVIADITDAKSVLQELQAIVPSSPSVAIQPLLLASQVEPGMFDFFKSFPWFLSTYKYESLEVLLASLEAEVIGPAETKAKQLRAN